MYKFPNRYIDQGNVYTKVLSFVRGLSRVWYQRPGDRLVICQSRAVENVTFKDDHVKNSNLLFIDHQPYAIFINAGR